MSDYTSGVITGVIIAVVAVLALSPVTGHIHASIAEDRAQAAMEEALGSMPAMPSMFSDEFRRDLQENIDSYMPR